MRSFSHIQHTLLFRSLLSLFSIAIIILACDLFDFTKDLPYKHLYIPFSILGLSIVLIFNHREVFKRKFKADYAFKSIHDYPTIDAILSHLYTFVIFGIWILLEPTKTIIITMCMTFTIIFLIKICVFFLHALKQPVKLVFKNDMLLLNRSTLESWTMSQLHHISYNRLTKTLKLEFDEDPNLLLQTRNYTPKDLQQILELLIEKSKHEIAIPANFKNPLV